MWRKLMMVAGVLVVVVLAAQFLAVRYLEHTVIFHPGVGINLTPESEGLDFEDLYLKTADGLLINAWFVKVSDKAATILSVHGNEGNMDDGDRLEKIKFFHDLGFNVLMFDYRGYGRSQGYPTEQGVYLDAQTAYDYLKTRSDIDHNRILAYGASLGGAVAIDLATKRKLAALIVDSCFTSAKDVAEDWYPFLPSWMMGVKFDNVSKVGNLNMPKLFMYSAQDEMVSRGVGEGLFLAAGNPKEFLLTSGAHNDGQFMRVLTMKAAFKKFLVKYGFIDNQITSDKK